MEYIYPEGATPIHLFSNGNGRHARLFTELVQKHLLKTETFTWGAADLAQTGTVRTKYISSLHEADKGNYLPLIEFARS
jgi:fido (protein-threonine AMPylation protein)